MTGRREVGQLVVLLVQDAVELFDAEFAASDLHHGADQAAYHTAEETVGFYPIDKTLFVLLPAAFVYGAVEGLYLGVAFGEGGKILVRRDEGGGGS